MRIELLGKNFNRWTVLSLFSGGKERKWLCSCSCGNTGVVRTQQLLNGMSKSCGCYRSDSARVAHTKHGHSAEKNGSYSSWLSMRKRCLTKTDKLYPYYGGRGISFCKDWENFENFLRDMGERPRGLTLERKRVNEDYGPENCCWATRRTQARNKRTTKLTLKKAIEIVQLRKTGMTYREIGEKYNIGPDHAWQINKGVLWPEARGLP